MGLQSNVEDFVRVKKKNKLIFIAVAVAFLTCIAFLLFLWSRSGGLNAFLASRYEMQGVDVSHYQGEIQWRELERQSIDFAYIKATEGSSSVDECFARNWREARETSLYVGAYHFFSFDSGGRTQGEHFIGTVGDLRGCLCPVVDVEYYGDKEKNPPPEKDVVEQLGIVLELLERTYGKKPIIYTTYQVYKKYIGDNFGDYPLWIRNVYYYPLFGKRGKWKFWQYTDTERMSGYQGTEACIDRDVFRGSREELKKYVIP